MRFNSSIIVVLVAIFSLAQAEIYYPKGYLKASTFEAPAVPEECDFAADVANVIDVTYSQFDNMGPIKSEVMGAVNWLQAEHPESRFALTIFTDKPIPPLGYNEASWKDYCLTIKSVFTDTNEHLESKLQKLRAGGGWDFPEAQLEALMRAIQTPQLGWRSGSKTPSGKNYVRVAITVTDSMAHEGPDAVDAAIAQGISPLPVTPNPLAVDPSIIATWENKACANMEYPSLQQLGNVIRQKDVIPVFLLAPQGYTCDDEPSGICPYPEFEKLAQETGNPDYLDPVKGMDLLYKSYLDKMNVVGIIQHLGYGFEGFYEKFVAALVEVGKLPETCFDPTTTTSTTSTSTTTTSTSTTTTSTSTTTTSTTTTSTTTTSTSTTTTSTSTTTTSTTTTSTTTTTTTSTTTPALCEECGGLGCVVPICCELCPEQCWFEPTCTTTSSTTTASTTTTSTTTTVTTTTTTTSTTTPSLCEECGALGCIAPTCCELCPLQCSSAPQCLASVTSTTTTTSSTTECECEGCCNIEVNVNVDVVVSQTGCNQTDTQAHQA